MRLGVIATVLVALFACPGIGAEGDWVVLHPSSVRATDGVKLTAQEDGSVLASEKNPDTATYEAVYSTNLLGITALRIEALTHESMPSRGPGRAQSGNLVLTEVEVSCGVEGSVARPKALTFTEARTDFSQSNYMPGHAIDGKIDPDTGWCPAGSTHHQDRYLVLLLSRPTGFKGGTRLKVRLLFKSSWAQHTMGRFRISASTRKDAEELLPAKDLVDEKEVDASTRRGIAWLLQHQEADGSWTGIQNNLYYGMTALAIYCMIQSGVDPKHPSIRAGFAYLKARPLYRTYDLGCALLAYRAAGEPIPMERVKLLTEQLVNTMGNGSSAFGGQWGYPFGHAIGSTANHTDLSNTQYALLGLRAGMKCGVKVPSIIFDRVARDLIDLQGDYGSIAYRKGNTPTASMTAAGMTSLLICAEGLELSARKGLAKKCLSAVRLSESWLRTNWSVTTNVEQPPNPNSGSSRWYYYYLQGLERVGSLSNRRMLAGHNWYEEGASAILARQNDDGSWSTAYGEKGPNTCFALLFLQRGTSSTVREGRPAASSGSELEGDFTIGHNGENPFVAWLRDLSPSIKGRLTAGEKVKELRWFVDGDLVSRVSPDPLQALSLQRLPLQHKFARNGLHDVQAFIQLQDGSGKETAETSSPVLEFAVDGVEEAFHREAIRDASENLVDPKALAVEASSETSGYSPAYVGDGRYSTGWRAGIFDRRPWIQLRLRRPVRAGMLKLATGHSSLDSPTSWPRPEVVEIRVNGKRPIVAWLLDNVRQKQTILFETTTVRSLRITPLTLYGSSDGKLGPGFTEIELYPEHHLREPDRPDMASVIPILPSAPDEAVRWNYRYDDPGPEWTHMTSGSGGWKSGEAPFGDAAYFPDCPSVWEGNDLWLRKQFRLGDPGAGELVLQVKVDDEAMIYINGILAGEIETYTSHLYSRVEITDAAREGLKSGLNTIALQCKDTGGARVVDVRLMQLPRGL